MPTHDAYARLTPYELAFPDRQFVADNAVRIRREAEEEAGGGLDDPGRFLSLVSVSEVLAEIRPREESSEGIHSYGLLLYHAVHFHGAGEPLYLLGNRGARYLVETSAEGSPPPEPPAPAGYLQLPRYLFWARPTDEETPEPVDGIFWTAPGDGRISLLVACGLREDRPGISVVSLPPLPLSHGDRWVDARVREEGRDFETTLPGGEVERLYSLEAAGEVLKLVARFFAFAGTASRAGEIQAPPEAPGPEAPRPTALSYRRVDLDGNGAEEEDRESDVGGRASEPDARSEGDDEPKGG